MQYKKYFPKQYNDKLLRRLASAYFDQPFNVQNTFMRQVMDYTFKESVDEGRPKYGKLKLTKDKPKKINKILLNINTIYTKNYGRQRTI